MNLTVWMVAPAPEEEVTTEETMAQPSDIDKSHEAQPDDMPVSTGDIKITIGRCFRCNKVGDHFVMSARCMALTFLNWG